MVNFLPSLHTNLQLFFYGASSFCALLVMALFTFGGEGETKRTMCELTTAAATFGNSKLFILVQNRNIWFFFFYNSTAKKKKSKQFIKSHDL